MASHHDISNFNRHFCRYMPPRPLEVIDADVKTAEEENFRLLNEVPAPEQIIKLLEDAS